MKFGSTGLGLLVLLGVGPAFAHHSLAMFNMTQRQSVSGTVAKVDWSNPHVSVWLYARKKDGQSGYDLYAFETGGVNLLVRFGWTPRTLPAGEKVTVEYFPLKDGKNGGFLIKAIHADGSVTQGDPLALASIGKSGGQP
jgi:hypothetical protein